MRLRKRRFRQRQRPRLWRKRNISTRRGLFAKLSDWWNRRRFYTFHKDEIITQKLTCTSPSHAIEQEDEVEWNNESESEDLEQYSDTASKHDAAEDKASQGDASEFGEDEVETLVTTFKKTVLLMNRW